MSGDANEAARLKEQKDAERGFDADSDEAHPAGGGDAGADPSDTEGAEMDPPVEGDKYADKIMPSGDKPRPAHK